MTIAARRPTAPRVPLTRAAQRTADVPSWLGRQTRRTVTYAATAAARHPEIAAALVAWAVWKTPLTMADVGAAYAGTVALAVNAVAFDHALGKRMIAILSRASSYRKRRRKIWRGWRAAMASVGMVESPLDHGGLKRMPRIKRMVETPLGVRAYVDGRSVAVGPADFARQSGRLCNAFGCRDVKASTHRGRIVLDFLWADPLSRVVPLAELPRSAYPGAVVVGVDEHGSPVRKHLTLPNLLVGAPGAGKSSEVWTILHQIQQAGIPYRVRVFDPKGGQEFDELSDAAWRYERNPLRWPEFVQAALSGLSARQASMRERGMRKHHPTWADPLDIMVIDELVTALAFDRVGKVKVDGRQITASDAFLVFLSQCRAAGYTVIALTQLGEKDSIGPIRGLFPNVSLLRVGPTETALVNVVLGSGAAGAYPAHELAADGSTAGVGWVRTDRGVVKYRAGFATDADRRRVAARMRADTARLRQREEP